MSEISSLQARLNQERARNNQLRGYLSELGSGVSSAGRRMDNFQMKVMQTLNDSNNKINTSHENIIRAYEIQGEIDKMYVRFKNMELANKKIRECNDKKYYDFANYSMIRKIVQGMLDNLNLNMISDEVIYKSVEKKHLQTPDYWLTSALLSIMAWKNDDKELAQRAMEISIKLDKKNTAIFFMLFNIRMHREEAALKWFMMYQECELKGSDERTFLMLFSLMSKTLRNEVSDKVKYEIIDFINRVIIMNAESEGFSEEILVDTIETYLSRMKGRDKLELNMLKRCLKDYAEVADIMVSAENNIAILQFIMDVGNVSEADKNEYIDRFINEEIAKPNAVELSVYDEIEYNELVIACNGDLERTNQIHEESQIKRANDLNLVSEMVDWIYNREAEDGDVNGQIRKNMFTLTSAMQKKAALQYAEHYRNRVKEIHPVVLGDYSTDVNFANRQNETQKITEYYEAEKMNQLSQITNTTAIIGAIVAVLGIAGVYFLGMGSLIISVAGAFLVALNFVSNNRHRKQIAETCELNIKSKNELMNQLFQEYALWKLQYEEYDSYFERVTRALDEFG